MSPTHTLAGDFYKILQIHRTATKQEVKEAYRKIALALHPDRHDGCEKKAEEFKIASEAYNTLLDTSKRRMYDESLIRNSTNYRQTSSSSSSSSWSSSTTTTTTMNTPNYRKVYTAQPPPGFKTFDPQRHYDMHYGDGMMKEEIERARKRAEAASNRYNHHDGYNHEYVSPLGKGFSFGNYNNNTTTTTWGQGSSSPKNPYSKSSGRMKKNHSSTLLHKNGTTNNTVDIEYEQGHFYDWNTSNFHEGQSIIDVKNRITDRMIARKKYRLRNRDDHVVVTASTNKKQQQDPNKSNYNFCNIM